MSDSCHNCGGALVDLTIVPGSPARCPTCGESQSESDVESRTRLAELWTRSVGETTDLGVTLKLPATLAATTPGSVTDRLQLRRQEVAQCGQRAHPPPDYEILRQIGEGGMGIVYRARQTSIDRTIALKMIKGGFARDPRHRSTFLSEAVATADLDHPNIVPIHELGENEAGVAFYAMKEVRGNPWSAVIGDKSQAENLEILMRVADAVAFAHSRGVIHRDLKPENVMLGDFGEVLVMDWGLAVAISPGAKADALDPGRALGGTPPYMAPEMALGDAEKIGVASDVYLLGAILFEIVSGKRPHDGATALACLQNAAANVITSCEESGELVDIAIRAMATELGGRYGSAKAFQLAVRTFQEHEESIVLAARAQESLSAARRSTNYEHFVDAIAAFKQALHLWEGNARAADGLVAARLDYAECAFRKQDYDLAVSLLDVACEAHRKLLHKVESARKERDTRLRRLRSLKAASAVSAASAVLILSVACLWVNWARRRADAQRLRAEAALEDLRGTAPTFYSLARELVGEQKFPQALTNIDYALSLVPDDARYHHLRGNILQSLLSINAAAAAYESAIRYDPAFPGAETNMTLCRQIAKDNVGRDKLMPGSLAQLLAGMRSQERFAEAIALSRFLGGRAAMLEPMMKQMLADASIPPERLAIESDGTATLDLGKWKTDDLAPLRGMPLTSLVLCFTDVRDLSPLAGMPLTSLNIIRAPVTDLSPLAGMPLRELLLGSQWGGCPVTDLSPLEGMPLGSLDLTMTEVADLSPLKAMPLESLVLACGNEKTGWRGSSVTDLSPLEDLPLISLTFVPDLAETGIDGVRGITSLTTINDMPADRFWRQYDAGEFLFGTRFKERIERSWPKARLEKAEGWTLALSLRCRRDVTNLEPLKGIPLSSLTLSGTRVTDLSPLRGMPLKSLILGGADGSCQVESLAPLSGMPLTMLNLRGCRTVRDLTPLEGMPLTSLILYATSVKDLSPLRGMPLKDLELAWSENGRSWQGSAVTDLTPLADLPLVSLSLQPAKAVAGLDAIRKIETLTTINKLPAAAFWRQHDAARSSGTHD